MHACIMNLICYLHCSRQCLNTLIWYLSMQALLIVYLSVQWFVVYHLYCSLHCIWMCSLSLSLCWELSSLVTSDNVDDCRWLSLYLTLHTEWHMSVLTASAQFSWCISSSAADHTSFILIQTASEFRSCAVYNLHWWVLLSTLCKLTVFLLNEQSSLSVSSETDSQSSSL